MRTPQYVGFFAIILIALAVAHPVARRVAEYETLVYKYGGKRVEAESLKIVDFGRHRLKISNGDTLDNPYATMAAGIWTILMVVLPGIVIPVLYFCLKRLIPWALPDRI